MRLRDLAALAGVRATAGRRARRVAPGGAAPFGQGRPARQPGRATRDSLLALRVNGADLSLDHGYPARVIVPANPGVHNTKWVTRMTFEA